MNIFSLASNLGIINYPIGKNYDNYDVVNGPRIMAELLTGKKFEFNFEDVRNVSDYYETILKDSLNAKDFIVENSNEKMNVYLGGDHSISFATILADLEMFKCKSSNLEEFGIIMIDTHSDIHQSQTSHSGNFHGMYLRPFFDKFDIGEIDNVVTDKLSGDNLIYLTSNSDFDKEEEMYLDKLFENKNKMLADFLKNKKFLHVSFDFDCLNSRIFDSTGLPNDGGFQLEEIENIFNQIKESHIPFNIDFVEFNPGRGELERSLECMRRVVGMMF